MALMAWTGP